MDWKQDKCLKVAENELLITATVWKQHSFDEVIDPMIAYSLKMKIL